jgi:outer membrane receptor protein involved in Fe transport
MTITSPMQRFVRYHALAAAFLLTIGLAPHNLQGQTETGQITGTISDPSGAGIPNATIKITSSATGAERTSTTGRDGGYNVSNLLPGEYNVAASATGFNPVQRKVVLTVGARLGQDFQLQVGTATTTVEVTENVAPVNVETQTQSEVISQEQIRELPTLTRNPYALAALAGNVSDVGVGNRGVGISINGMRESSTNTLLDGGSNNDEFTSRIGQQIPLDAVQEFSVLTNNFTAEYGRASGGVVNVVSKSGSNSFHGTGWEFNRVSDLASNTFQNNANGVDKPVFVRNQFGYTIGGPVKKNKLFFFSSTEWTRVRSAATNFAWVPTPQFIALTPANTQNFFSTLGQLRPGLVTLGSATCGSGLFTCPAAIPAGLPVFNHVAYNAPSDAGGGQPQNTWDTFQRVDYNLSDRTQIYGRYALYSEQDQAGTLVNSPYNNFDLGQTYYNHNFLFSVTHTFAPTLIAQTKVVFNRLTNLQPGLTSRGLVPTMYPNATGAVTIGTDDIAFPGYYPFTPGNGGAFGGPQNIIQFYHDMTWTHGSHSVRFGGSYDYIRDNRTYAAYQTAVDALSPGVGGVTPSLQALLNGTFDTIKVAVDPQGKFPCVGGVATPACSVSLPVNSPNFSRSNRFHEGALYLQDSWKLRPNFTVNLGMRWEYFGVQHNKNDKLDANWYAPVGFADSNLGAYLRTGGIQVAPQSPVGALWRSDYTSFGPRIGFAWDITGDGKTSLRAGYGIGYERNFGNVTFNLIQNPPNYAVLGVPGPITTANFGPLAGSGGTLPLPRVGARIVDPNIKNAYAHTWNASIERQIGGGAIYAVQYSGSQGVHLYSIAYPNQTGYGNMILGDPCAGTGDCNSQPNSAYSQSVGYRGNLGFSLYNGLTNKLTLRNFHNSGVDVTFSYTWSHAIDNLSSTFFEAGGGGLNNLGNQNITINNGDYVYGLLDPYHPNLDKGDSEFDIRHRVVMAAVWTIPGAKSGIARFLTSGWSLTPIFSAHSGQPFSIFDTGTDIPLGLNAPRAAFTGPVPIHGGTLTATSTPDVYNYMTFSDSQIAHPSYTFVPGFKWPSNMSGRDIFRGPGWWNLDVGVYKNTRITERVSFQLRLETFNLFNHANLYVNGVSADVGSSNSVTSCFGCTGSTYDRRHLQLGAKIIF